MDVVIDGRNFTVVGEGSEEYVKGLADYVDEKIRGEYLVKTPD